MVKCRKKVARECVLRLTSDRQPLEMDFKSTITLFLDLGTSIRNSSPAGSSAPELCETDGDGDLRFTRTGSWRRRGNNGRFVASRAA